MSQATPQISYQQLSGEKTEYGCAGDVISDLIRTDCPVSKLSSSGPSMVDNARMPIRRGATSVLWFFSKTRGRVERSHQTNFDWGEKTVDQSREHAACSADNLKATSNAVFLVKSKSVIVLSGATCEGPTNDLTNRPNCSNRQAVAFK